MPQIIDKSADEIQSWVKSNSACLIDVREDSEFAVERIPNTDMHMPLSRFNPKDIPLNSPKKLVFVCSQGVRSLQIGQYLLDNEFLNEAYNLKHGIVGWNGAGLPIEKD